MFLFLDLFSIFASNFVNIKFKNAIIYILMTSVTSSTVKMSKLPKVTLSLKQFMLRQEVLKLYRDIFRTLRHVSEASTRKDLKEWARTDFRNNKHHTDESTIKAMLHYGKKSLKDLEKSMALSK